MKTGLQLCSLALQVLVGGFASSKTPSASSGLWIWASWVFRRGTMNASVCEMGKRWVISCDGGVGEGLVGFLTLG